MFALFVCCDLYEQCLFAFFLIFSEINTLLFLNKEHLYHQVNGDDGPGGHYVKDAGSKSFSNG